MDHRTHHLTAAKRIAKRYGIRLAISYWRESRRAPEAMKAWNDLLDQHVEEAGRDALLVRAFRPYMRQHFSIAQRRDVLQYHYRSMAQHFLNPLALRAEPGMLVSTLVGKNEARYSIYFGGNTSKEGELTFSLYDADGHYMAKMEGTIGPDEDGKPVLWIGGLQGAKPPLGRDEVVKATRDLFGLRPKGAVMIAAQIFASELGLTALRAPDNEGHISQRGFRKLRSKRKIFADYGQFWEEVGGIKLSDEEYSLPITPQVRDMSEVKPNKRSEWKKRQALSEQLASDMRAALASITRAD